MEDLKNKEFYNVRFDFLRLSTEDKPGEVVDGSTLYEVDTSNFYISYKNEWYLQG